MKAQVKAAVQNWRTSTVGVVKLVALGLILWKTFHLILSMNDIGQLSVALSSLYVVLDSVGNFLQKDAVPTEVSNSKETHSTNP